MTGLEQLRRAIQDEGPQPEFHRAVMRRHRAEWPTLWRAIDTLLAESDDQAVERFGSKFPR